MRDRLQRARPAREAAARARRVEAGCWPRGSWRSTRTTTPTWSRSCSRPTASPTCSTAPTSSSASPTRTTGSSTACATCATRRKQAKELAALEAEVQDATNRILRERNEIAAARGARSWRAGRARSARATSARRARARCATAAWRARGRPRGRSRREQARVHGRRDPGPLARADQARLGQLHLAGERADRLAVRHALGPPARRASTSPCRAARRSAPPIGGRVAAEASSGGYGNYTCIPHSGGISTCYAHQSSFALDGADREPGPGDRHVGLHRPLLRPAPALRGARERRAGRPLGYL